MCRRMLLVNIQKSIARLTLNSIQKRNALSCEMLKELKSHLKSIESDSSIRVVILKANGPAFSSGHDLREFQCTDPVPLMDLCSDVMQSITSMTKPVIAQVDGVATAAGCQLVASCDLAFASHASRFATPGVNLGLFCSTPSVALGRCVSRKHAMKMLLTGEMITAQEAERIGLINEAVDDVGTTVDTIADTIASKSATAIRMGKPIFYQQLEMPLAQAYQLTSKTMVDNAKQDDAKEGIDAFLTKRQPNWS